MARLSNLTGNYTTAGGIIDRQQVVGTGGETRFSVSFVDGAEEVYLNGARLFKGASQDYVTGTDSNGSYVELNAPLELDDELLLIGRASTNEIPYNRAQGESVTLSDGQLVVDFSSIETDGIEVYVSGPIVDRGRLTSPEDFEITNLSRITLTHSYPAGTVLEGVQGGRLAWVDPDNMVVNDGTNVKSLSARFRDMQETVPYFIQTHGTNLQDLKAGLRINKWIVGVDGNPVEDISGSYPVLRLGSSYWYPAITGPSSAFIVSSWSIQGQTLTITALDEATNIPRELVYGQNRAVGIERDTAVDYGLITSAVYDQYDDGGL